MIIIVKGSRKDLVRKQKACIDEVNRYPDKAKEVIEDHIRWSKESGIFNDERGRKLVSSYEYKGKRKKEIEKGKEKQEIIQ